MTTRWGLHRWRAGAVAAVPVALVFVVALLIDREAADAAAHEGRRLLALGTFVSLFGLSGYMLALSAALAAGAAFVLRRSRRPPIVRIAWDVAERAVFFFAAIAASGIVCQILKHLVGRPRPRFLTTLGPFHFAGPNFRSGFEGFPSGHSTTAFAAATALSMIKPAWSVAFYAAAVLICLSRILAEAHYPSDTVAGAVLGTLVTSGLARLFATRGIAFHRDAVGAPHAGGGRGDRP